MANPNLFGFDQEIGGVVNQSPLLEVPRNDPLSKGGMNLKTIVIILVVLLVVWKFVLHK